MPLSLQFCAAVGSFAFPPLTPLDLQQIQIHRKKKNTARKKEKTLLRTKSLIRKGGGGSVLNLVDIVLDTCI